MVDVCTQRDYLFPDGAQPCVNCREALCSIKHLFAFARWAKVPVLSCVEARRPQDVRGLIQASCVLGTRGQLKLPCSLMPSRGAIDSDNCLCVSLEVFQAWQQVILYKEHRDPFTNPKLDRLLTELPARRFVLLGAGLECTVRLLALGLLLRHRRVAVVYDACGWWNGEDGAMAMRQLGAKGCELLSVEQYIQSSAAQFRRNLHLRPTRRRSVA
jgi:nicotinamidase-related amidase